MAASASMLALAALTLTSAPCSAKEEAPRKFSFLLYLPMSSPSHANVFRPVARGLADRGHRVTVVSPFAEEVTSKMQILMGPFSYFPRLSPPPPRPATLRWWWTRAGTSRTGSPGRPSTGGRAPGTSEEARCSELYQQKSLFRAKFFRFTSMLSTVQEFSLASQRAALRHPALRDLLARGGGERPGRKKVDVVIVSSFLNDVGYFIADRYGKYDGKYDATVIFFCSFRLNASLILLNPSASSSFLTIPMGYIDNPR